MLVQFKLIPEGVGDEPDVKFDITSKMKMKYIRGSAIFILLVISILFVALKDNEKIPFDSDVWKSSKKNAEFHICHEMLWSNFEELQKEAIGFEDVLHRFGEPDAVVNQKTTMIYYLGRGRMPKTLFSTKIRLIFRLARNGKYRAEIIPG